MSRRLAIHVAGFAFVLFFMVGGDMNAADIDGRCWYCICKASSNCNANLGCTEPFLAAYSCGPLSISWPYWADAGGPRLEGDGALPSEIAFVNCVKDIYCAIQTVKKYVQTFEGTECYNNTCLTCENVIRIHIMGGYACNDPGATNDTRYLVYKECMDEPIQEHLPSKSKQDKCLAWWGHLNINLVP